MKGLFLNGRSCGKIEKGMGNIAVGKSLTANLIKGHSAWMGRNLGKAFYSKEALPSLIYYKEWWEIPVALSKFVFSIKNILIEIWGILASLVLPTFLRGSVSDCFYPYPFLLRFHTVSTAISVLLTVLPGGLTIYNQ